MRNIAVHKGLPFGQRVVRALDVRRHRPRRQALPRRELPDLSLGIRRRASRKGRTTRRAPTASTRWSRACSKNGVKPGGNVYAELGSTWRFLMRDPDAAAHAHRQAAQVRAARTTCCGAPTRSGTARRRTRSRRSARSRSRDALARQARLPEDHAGAAREGLRPQRARACTRCRTTCCASTCARDRVAREREDYRERAGPDVRHPRARRRGGSS